MDKYVFKVTHDHGFMTISVPARSEQAAKNNIGKMELCPDNALKLIKVVKDGDEKPIYYTEQLNQIEFNGEYAATIRIQDYLDNKTKWMDLNRISAKAIIDTLKDKFDL